MMSFFKNRLNRGAIRITGGSFLFGNALFLGYLAFPLDSLFGIGIAFVVLFITIQILQLATLFLNAIINYKDYEENLMACIFTTVNVALAFLYLNLI